MLNKLEKAFYWLKSKKIRIIDTVVIVCLLMSYILFKSTDINLNLDFNYNVEIHSGYATFINRHEDAYVIDSGKNRLLKIQDKEVIWSIGEEDETHLDGQEYLYCLCITGEPVQDPEQHQHQPVIADRAVCSRPDVIRKIRPVSVMLVRYHHV